MANTIEIVITAKDQASGVFSGISGALGGLGSAILPVVAGVTALAGGFVLAAKAGLDQIISHEKLTASLTNLAARELQATSGIEKMLVVGQAQVALTEKEQKELDKLNGSIGDEIQKRDQLSGKINIANQELAKLETAEKRNETAIQRKRLQIEDLTYKYSDLNSTIDQHQGRIGELTDKTGQYTDVLQKVREGQISMDEALAQAAPIAEELTRWVEKLGILSPFTSEQIGLAFKTAMAYGFTMEEAKKLTQSEVDFAAAMGAGVEVTNQIALALGQMKAKGKVSGQELIQLTNAGIGTNAILKNMGFTLDDVSNGLVDSDAFIQAVIDDMNIFKGAAERQSTSWAGLLSTLSEVKDIGLREFFTGFFEAIQPLVATFVTNLQNALPTIRAWGDAFGKFVSSKVIPAVQEFFGFVGEIIDIFKSDGLGAAAGFAFGRIGEWINKVWTETLAPLLTDLGTRFWDWITTTVIPLAQEKATELWQAFVNFVSVKWPIISEALGELAGKFWDWVNLVVVPQIPGVLEGLMTSLTTWLNTKWPVINEELTRLSASFWNWVNELMAQAGPEINKLFTALAEWIMSDEAQTKMSEMGEAIGKFLFDGLKLILENQDEYSAVMTRILLGLLAAVGIALGMLVIIGWNIALGIITGLIEKITGADMQALTVNSMIKLLGDVASLVIGEAIKLGQTVSSGIQIGITSWREKITGSLINIVTIISAKFDEIVKFAESLITRVREILSSGFTEFTQKVSNFLVGLVNLVSEKLNMIVGFFSDLITRIRDALSNGFAELKSNFSEFLAELVSTVQGKIDEIISFFSGLGAKISGALGGISLKAIGGKIMDGLIEGITSKMDAIKEAIIEAVKKAIKAAKEALGIGSPSLVFANIGQQMMSGLALGIAGSSYLPAMASVGAVSNIANTTNYYFNQTVNTRATTATVSQDFETMRAIIGAR